MKFVTTIFVIVVFISGSVYADEVDDLERQIAEIEKKQRELEEAKADINDPYAYDTEQELEEKVKAEEAAKMTQEYGNVEKDWENDYKSLVSWNQGWS